MSTLPKLFLFLIFAPCLVESLQAQLPFYTDDTGVTEPGKLHFEFFNELDRLQFSEFPNVRQNTANFRINFGLPHNLEMDVDIPYLAIFRDVSRQNSTGAGDTDMGLKWRFRNASRHLPALAASLYIEFPTGDERQELGSGLTDYALNFIAQEPLTEKTRVNLNIGFLFAGNTSTGVLGIQTTHGHVYTGGLSLLHDLGPRLTLGGEVYGAHADADGLGRSQLQFLGGGQYTVRRGLSLTFALLGGKYEASPRIGGQGGFAVDFPDILHNRSAAQSPFHFLRTGATP
jgi:hypothetical protein